MAMFGYVFKISWDIDYKYNKCINKLKIGVYRCSTVQSDQINIAVFFSGTLQKVTWSGYGTLQSTPVHWTIHYIQGTIRTRPCLTGLPVPVCKIIVV